MITNVAAFFQTTRLISLPSKAIEIINSVHICNTKRSVLLCDKFVVFKHIGPTRIQITHIYYEGDVYRMLFANQ